MSYLITKIKFERYTEQLVETIGKSLSNLKKVDTDRLLKSYYTLLSGKVLFVNVDSKEKDLLLASAFKKIKNVFSR